MKLGLSWQKPVWPWWNGLWFGVMLGVFAGAWLSRGRWIDSPTGGLVTPMVSGFCLFMGILPDLIFDIGRGIRRYRQAARR